jgi:parallel beta-helix repeat protein
MEKIMIHHSILTPICLAASLAFVIGTAQATEVNCNRGETIADALQRKGKTINIKGTCVESPTFIADDITLRGIPGFAPTVFGTITVDGAQRFRIEGIKVTGSTDFGIGIINGSTATIVDNMINDNTSSGISVLFGSSAVLTGNTITGNGEGGINVSYSSHANLLGGNTVNGNTEDEIFVSKASSFHSGVSPYTGIHRDTFMENEADLATIHVKENSNVDIRDSDINCTALCTNAVESVDTATFRAQNNTKITGNIFAFHGGVRIHVR